MLKTLIVGISGGVASGKSTICSYLIKELQNKGYECCLLDMDSYYKDLSEEEYKNLKEINFDRPEYIDIDKVFEDLVQLETGKTVKTPIYNMITSKREINKYKEIKPCEIIIIEGIYSLYDKVY